MKVVNERSYQFEWDEGKAAALMSKSTRLRLNWRPQFSTIRGCSLWLMSITAKRRNGGFLSEWPEAVSYCQWRIFGRRPMLR